MAICISSIRMQSLNGIFQHLTSHASSFGFNLPVILAFIDDADQHYAIIGTKAGDLRSRFVTTTRQGDFTTCGYVHNNQVLPDSYELEFPSRINGTVTFNFILHLCMYMNTMYIATSFIPTRDDQGRHIAYDLVSPQLQSIPTTAYLMNFVHDADVVSVENYQ